MGANLKARLWLFSIFACLCAARLSYSAAADNGLVTKPSKYPATETIDRFETAVKIVAGFQIIARIDFQTLAATQGGKVRLANC